MYKASLTYSYFIKIKNKKHQACKAANTTAILEFSAVYSKNKTE